MFGGLPPDHPLLASDLATATRAGIATARFIHSGWPMADPPTGAVALDNHVTYLTRDIVPFLLDLDASALRRVVLTVNAPPPPPSNRALFRVIHDEERPR